MVNIESEKAAMMLAVEGPGFRVYVEWNEKMVGLALRGLDYLRSEVQALDLKQLEQGKE